MLTAGHVEGLLEAAFGLGEVRDRLLQQHDAMEDGFRDVQHSLGVIDSKLSTILPLDLGLGTTLATDFLRFQRDDFSREFGECAILNVGTTILEVRIAFWAAQNHVLGTSVLRIRPNTLASILDTDFREGGCPPLVECWCTFTFDGPANAVRAHLEKFVEPTQFEAIPTSVAREVAR